MPESGKEIRERKIREYLRSLLEITGLEDTKKDKG